MITKLLAQPLSTQNTTTKSPSTTRRSIRVSELSQILILIVVALVGIIALQQKHDWKEGTKEIERLTNEIVQLKGEVESVEYEVQVFESMSESQICQNPFSPNLTSDNKTDEETPFVSHMDTLLKDEIIRQAKRSAMYKYGNGPHKIEMQLNFYVDGAPQGTSEKIVIEMAPLDLMPFTVSFFLDRVSEGFYDGHKFDFNAGHVVIATHLKSKYNDDQLLINAIIQEYHPSYPHEKYTLGYTKKENNIYISTQDNSIAHAYAKETCFARVVDGFDAVDRIHNMPIGELGKFVVIEKATILGVNEKCEFR